MPFFFFSFRGGGGVWFSSRWLFGTQLVVTQSGWRCRRPAEAVGVDLRNKRNLTTPPQGGMCGDEKTGKILNEKSR